MDDTIYDPVPEDLNKAATKGDLKLLSINLEGRLENIPTKTDFNELLTLVDKFARQVKTYNEERSVEGARIER